MTDADGTGRAEDLTLTTVDTIRFCNLFVKCRHHHSFGTTECKIKCAYSLQLIADTYTVTTKNTFIRITHDGRRTEINWLLLSVVVVSYTGHAKTVCQRLQITVTALDTGSTVSAVGSQ